MGVQALHSVCDGCHVVLLALTRWQGERAHVLLDGDQGEARQCVNLVGREWSWMSEMSEHRYSVPTELGQ